MNKLFTSLSGKRHKTASSTKTFFISLIRIITGIMLLQHGAQKIFQWKFAGTRDNFSAMGVPMPSFSAIFAMVAEFGGGLLLILGLFTSLGAALNIINLLGAIFTVHIKNIDFSQNGYTLIDNNTGIELPIIYLLVLIAIWLFDNHRFSVNKLLQR